MSGYSFRKHQALSLRIWHWTTATVIAGLLATVALRKTFLSWRSNSALIEEKLKAAGLAITPEMAKDIAVSIRNPMWQWHIYLGYALAGLLLARIAIAVLVEKRSPLGDVIKAALGLKTVPASEKGHALHYTLVKLGYAAFYLATALMVATGMAMAFKDALGLQAGLLETAKEVHETAMWFFVVFGAGHIIGVLVAENRQDPGLVSDMIHGGPKA